MAALTKRVFVVMATVFLCSAFCLPPAEAALVPIAITAEVTQVFDDFGFLEGRVGVGDLITGVYIYDSSTPDSGPGPEVGVYEHRAPPCGVTLTVGGFVFMTDPDNVEFIFRVENDSLTIIGPRDKYEFRSENNLPLSNGAWVNYVRLQLRDYSANALSSDALPTTALVLDDWQIGEWDLVIAGDSFSLRGRLTSTALIPEPATLALLGIGTLVLLRSRRAQKNCHLPI